MFTKIHDLWNRDETTIAVLTSPLITLVVAGFLTGCGESGPPPSAVAAPPMAQVAVAELHPNYTKDSRTGLCFAWISHNIPNSNAYSFAFTQVPCEKVERHLSAIPQEK